MAPVWVSPSEMDAGQGVETGLELLGRAALARGGGAASGIWTGGTVLLHCEEV
jgi:hypothetical protein